MNVYILDRCVFTDRIQIDAEDNCLLTVGIPHVVGHYTGCSMQRWVGQRAISVAVSVSVSIYNLSR